MLQSKIPALSALKHYRPLQFIRGNSTGPSGGSSRTTTTFKYQPLPKLKRDGRRAAYIRTWAMIDNIADAYTIIRAVEQRYGRIAEARILRDFEMPEMYQAKMLILFRDSDSITRIPSSGENLAVPAPDAVADQPGGIGLTDIEHLLEQGRDESLSLSEGLKTLSVHTKKGKGRMINFKIEPKLHITPPSKPLSRHLSSRRLEETGRNFLKWGGFYDLRPIESTRPITDDELFCGSSLDHVRMRRTLRYWAEATGDQNPYEIPPKDQPVKDVAENVSIPPTTQLHTTDLQELEIQSTIPSSDVASSLSEKISMLGVAATDISPPLESTPEIRSTQDLAADMLQTSILSSSEDVSFLEVGLDEEPSSQRDKNGDPMPQASNQ